MVGRKFELDMDFGVLAWVNIRPHNPVVRPLSRHGDKLT